MLISEGYMDELFDGFAPGQALLAEVRQFYGPRFWVEQRVTSDGESQFSVDPRDAAGASGVIRLNTTTTRVKAAAVHELLHLALPARGFPVIDTITAPPAFQAQLSEIMKRVINVAQHDIFIKEFVASGLSSSDFMIRQTNPRYPAESKKIAAPATHDDRCRWAFEYYRQHISITHGDHDARLFADSCRKHAMAKIASFDAMVAAIDGWVADKAHHDLDQYAKAIQELVRVLELPVAHVGFCKLVADPGKAPRLIVP